MLEVYRPPQYAGWVRLCPSALRLTSAKVPPVLIAQLAALVARGARGLSSLVDPRAVQRRARATVGVFSLLFVIVMLVNGVGGSTVGPISSSRAMRARASRTRGLCYSVQYVIR